MSAGQAWIDQGLDLSNLDATESAEIERFRESYRKSHGKSLAAYEFWLRFDPAVAKLHRTQILGSSSQDTAPFPLLGTLGFLYLYAADVLRGGRPVRDASRLSAGRVGLRNPADAGTRLYQLRPPQRGHCVVSCPSCAEYPSPNVLPSRRTGFPATGRERRRTSSTSICGPLRTPMPRPPARRSRTGTSR